MPKWSPEHSTVTADLLALKAVPPLIARGQVTFEGPTACVVATESECPGLKVGMDVVIDACREAACRLIGHVVGLEGHQVRIQVRTVVPTDQRIFPRMWGGIEVRYRPVQNGEPGDTLESWLAGAPAEGSWSQPAPYMDFSASGLRFEDRETCQKDDRVLLEFRLPFRAETWRATARVVRVAPLTPEELADQDPSAEVPATHEVALEFIDLGPGAIDSLMDFTRRLQEVFV